MPVTFVKGDFINDLPKGKPRAFACPVDVLGTSDVGIAAAVAKRWPGFGEWWRAQRKQIGDVAVFEADGDLIFALVIQRGSKRSKLGWLERAVRGMLVEAANRKVTHLNVSRIWGGTSGLEGSRAKRIIDDAASSAPIELTVFEQFIRGGAGPAPDAEPAAEDEAEDEDEDEGEGEGEEASAPKKKKAAAKKKTAAKTKTAAPAKKKTAAPAKKTPAKKKTAPAKKKTTAKKK